jgi:pilus assembly protein CpaF
MLRGLGRVPFGPKSPFGAGAGTSAADPPASSAPTAAEPTPGPSPSASGLSAVPAAPPAPQPSSANAGRAADLSREPDPAQVQFEELKRHIHTRLVDRLDMNRVGEMDPKSLRNEIRGVVEHLCDTENPLLNRNERQRLVNEILDETFGFGPLELLLKDDKIGDIMINGPRKIYVEKGGRIQRSDVVFRDNDHLLQIIDRIVSRVGRRVDETSPMVDARLPDGSRFNAIIPPLALDGAVVTIRMFGSKPLSKDDLIRFKAFTPEMLELMEGAMKARLNVIISGGTGSGKTTLLNTLSSFIQPDHRVITIEDAAELQLQQDHVVRLETRPANIEGRGAITATDLVKNALRMRPDRIIIGECRGAETLDMIQAMNTGHEGSMTTVHANTPRDALSRLETMISMAGLELPIRALRSQFASAVDLIIQASRLQGGPRKVTSISEVIGMEGDTIIMQEIFAFRQIGVDADGRAHGEFIATGIRPTFMDRLEATGCHLSPDLFRQRVLLKD